MTASVSRDEDGLMPSPAPPLLEITASLLKDNDRFPVVEASLLRN
jgi:hypothetical protein